MLIKYIQRYANDSGDEKSISFNNKFFTYQNNDTNKSDYINRQNIYENPTIIKESLENSIIDSILINSNTPYKDYFNPIAAGQWAYENYGRHTEDFPNFHHTNEWASNCTNFVSQALHVGGSMLMNDKWYCFKKNGTYCIPANAYELNYNWTLSDPSPWISLSEFDPFWTARSDYYFQYSKNYYINYHDNLFFDDPIVRGDVIILCKTILWFTIPYHAMIVSDYDFDNGDLKLAGDSNPRKAYPLLEAIQDYDAVRMICMRPSN